ncbi:MAG: PDZ domain-containing protein [Pseudomarimonas sp.]
MKRWWLVPMLAMLVAPGAMASEPFAVTAEQAQTARRSEQDRALAERARARADAAVERSADLGKAQAELRRAQEELNALSSRVAGLSMQIARADIEAALARPAFDRPMIGVILRSDPQAGVGISAVTPDSPAERAGLRPGDRIIEINGDRISDGSAQARLNEARERLSELEVGQVLSLDYLRDKQRTRVEVTADLLPGLAWWRGRALDADAVRAQIEPLIALRGLLDIERIAPMPPCVEDGGECMTAQLAFADSLRWRGLRMAAVDSELGRYFATDRGVLVLSAEKSPLKGLRAGDVLLSIDDQDVNEPTDVLRALRDGQRGDEAQRDGQQDRKTEKSLVVRLMRDRKAQQLELQAAALPSFPAFAPPVPPIPPLPPTPALAPLPPMPSALPTMPAAPAAPTPPPAPPPPPSRGVLESVLI